MTAGRRSLLIVIVISLALIIGVSLFAPLVAPHDPLSQRLQMRFLPPGSDGFPMGTDNLGRDILSRVIYGGRSALLVEASPWGSVSFSVPSWASVRGSVAGLWTEV